MCWGVSKTPLVFPMVGMCKKKLIPYGDYIPTIKIPYFLSWDEFIPNIRTGLTLADITTMSSFFD